MCLIQFVQLPAGARFVFCAPCCLAEADSEPWAAMEVAGSGTQPQGVNAWRQSRGQHCLVHVCLHLGPRQVTWSGAFSVLVENMGLMLAWWSFFLVAGKSSHLFHQLLFGSGLWTILFCQIFLCMADAWIISGQMAGLGDILIWAISKSFGDVFSLVLTVSTSHGIPREWVVPVLKLQERQVLDLSKNHRGPRAQRGVCALKDWNSNSDFFQKLKSI